MNESKTFGAVGPISFIFNVEDNEIHARYNSLGFIKVYLNGELVASKWSPSTSSFILFNIEADLYSIQMTPDRSDEILGICTLVKNEQIISRQKLVFSRSPGPRYNLVFSTFTIITCSIAFLFATGCIYWDVSDLFYYVLYSAAGLMFVFEITRALLAVPVQVIAENQIAPSVMAHPAKPLKTTALITQSSKKISYADKMIIYCVGFFVLIIAGWKINYLGEPIKVHSGTVIYQQWISTGLRLGSAFAFAKVEIAPGKVVKVDCPNSKMDQKVVVHEKIAVILRNTIYQCAE